MSARALLKRLIRTVAAPTFFLGLTTYFGWNVLHGDHGIRAYQSQMHTEQDALTARKNAIDEQTIWRRRVVALKEHALDADMIDERARAMLNLTQDGDIVVPYGPRNKLY